MFIGTKFVHEIIVTSIDQVVVLDSVTIIFLSTMFVNENIGLFETE